jgi:hypothetical protein
LRIIFGNRFTSVKVNLLPTMATGYSVPSCECKYLQGRFLNRIHSLIQA